MNSMEKIPVRTATVADQDRVIAAIVLGFSADPVARWSYPEPNDYLNHFPRIVKAFGGNAFEYGSAYHVDGFLGAALWLPPNVEPREEEMTGLLQDTIGEDRQEEVFSLLEQMGNYHPSEPHWYLPLIGVDPIQQGKGYGEALMAHALTRCDRDKVPAYLESTNPRNIPLYRRHGFEVLGTIQAGSCPPVSPMLRWPRTDKETSG
jgi:ribosomal protein S18 acetylase RimI-like enzyme